MFVASFVGKIQCKTKNLIEVFVHQLTFIHGDDGHKVFSIRVKEEIVAEIEGICAKTGHSRNELIGIFLEYALKNCEIEDNEN